MDHVLAAQGSPGWSGFKVTCSCGGWKGYQGYLALEGWSLSDWITETKRLSAEAWAQHVRLSRELAALVEVALVGE